MILNYHPKLIERVVDETPKTIVGLIISSLIVIFVYKDYVPNLYIVIWVLAQSIFIFLRFLNAKYFHKHLLSNDTKKMRFQVFVFAALIIYSAIVWTIGTIGGAIYTGNYFEFFSFIMIMGLITASTMSLSSIFSVFVLYFLFMLIPQIIFISSFNEKIHEAILFLALIFIPYIFLISKSMYKNLLYTIEDNVKLSEAKILLETAKEKAEESTRLKSNFLANMSHEIRTPMHSIIGMTYILQKTTLDKNQHGYLQKITNATNNLLFIINDILDFSKIEVGKLELNRVDFDMNEILKNIKNLLDDRASEKSIELDIPFFSESRFFYGDSLRLSQIVVNLLSNAIKFTDKGKVTLVVKELEDGRVRFSIKDTGIGIDPSQMISIFESFSQGDSDTTRKYGGTGLGLSISKELVELMGGKIWVESSLGIGSEFIFEIDLPIGDLKFVEVVENLNLEVVKKEEDIGDNQEDITNFKRDNLFRDLKKVIKTSRPIECKKAIDKFKKYKLCDKDEKLFTKVNKLIYQYKFKEALALLEDLY